MKASERGFLPERLAYVDKQLLRHLGSLVGKHPERFCPEPRLSMLCAAT
jgi:hypothetical protein